MRNRKPWIRGLIFVCIAAAILGVGLYLLNRYENAQYQSTRGDMTEGFGQLRTITVDGVRYREKPAVTTMLLAGIDKEEATENVSQTSYREGGQADFLMLLAIDHTDQKIYRFQIERDTMAEIDILGVFGNEVGTRTEQICLAHSFGATPEENAKYTMRAVERLLGGLSIDSYYMIDYTAMDDLADALGGIPVTVPDNMTSVNPAWTKGSKITLMGKDAENFVRIRKTIGQGTNKERMVRQDVFMTSAIAVMKQKTAEDLSFGEELLKKLQKLSVTNMTQKWLAEEINQSHAYETLPVDHPAGTYTMGRDGFVEFHMEEGEAEKWILANLYTRVE